MSWSVSTTATPNTHVIEYQEPFREKDWEAYVLVTSDWHWDNPHCKRKLLYRHLQEALDRNAPVIANGDTFCLMQGRYDPRRKRSDIRPEHNVDNYLDAVIEDAAGSLAPYRDVLTVFGVGNHESTILKHTETNVLQRFCATLRHKHGAKHCYTGGYGGYILLRFKDIHSTRSLTVRLKYFHGAGGGGPVTKGVIQTNRRAAFIHDADVIATGHIHERWYLETAVERLSTAGRPTIKPQIHICTATYKDEYDIGADGWMVERGSQPKPLGGMWLRITYHRKKNDGVDTEALKIQPIPA